MCIWSGRSRSRFVIPASIGSQCLAQGTSATVIWSIDDGDLRKGNEVARKKRQEWEKG